MFHRVILAFIVLFPILFTACDRVSPRERVDLNCGNETERTFEDWRSWTKATANVSPLASDGHPGAYVDVYVDDLAKDIYMAASGPYPECARIIKAKYTDETATQVERLAVMVKMPAGYDPRYNDWWYARYDPTGTQAIDQGKLIISCGKCHQRAEDTDFLFSEEVLAATNE